MEAMERGLLIGTLGLLGMSLSTVHAQDFKVWSVPLTDRSYGVISLDSVQPESIDPSGEWKQRVYSKNSDLIVDLTIVSVLGIEVTRRDPEIALEVFEPLVLEARQRAAKAGANVLYLEKTLMKDGQLNGLRFKAYRIQYKNLLVSPTYVASLTDTPVQAVQLEDDLHDWDSERWGKTQISENVPGFLDTLKKGTPVRVVLQDGSDFKGTYAGLDEDQVWLQPEGWIGLVADRSFQVKDVQRVGLFQ
jgi:hypothetical protein